MAVSTYTTRVQRGEGPTQVAQRVYGDWQKWTWLAHANGWPDDAGQLRRWTGPVLKPGDVVIVPDSDPGVQTVTPEPVPTPAPTPAPLVVQVPSVPTAKPSTGGGAKKGVDRTAVTQSTTPGNVQGGGNGGSAGGASSKLPLLIGAAVAAKMLGFF